MGHCIDRMQKRSCINTEMQLQKSLNNVVEPILISSVFAIDDAPRSCPWGKFGLLGLVVQMFVRASFSLMADQRLIFGTKERIMMADMHPDMGT